MTKNRHLILALIDIGIIYVSYLFSIYLRFEGDLVDFTFHRDLFMNHSLLIVVLEMLVFYFFGLYEILWRYASFQEYLKLIKSLIVANIISALYFILTKIGMPRSIFAIVFIMQIFLMMLVRMSARLSVSTDKVDDEEEDRRKSSYKKTMIVGAGEAGALTLKELQKHPEIKSAPVCIIDDDATKHGKTILGVKIIGGRDKIKETVEREEIDEIIVSIPSISTDQRQEILEICTDTSAQVKILPGYYQFVDGKSIDHSSIRDVQIEDLLGREPVKLDEEKLRDFIKGKLVLVTGAGGSIGSELCRQIGKYQPKELIMLDIYENSIYGLELELKKMYPDLNMKVLIESVRDKERIDYVFSQYRPDLVFHAAAHKHVPLMEDSPAAAIKNNVFGTLNVCNASDEYGVEKFVLISTDKAVNPTSVMGTTKRICEMIINVKDQSSDTDFVGVRFGNVIGSNGSVIPIFKRQIKEGGPVTVTDKNIVRYFMTIPEACQLVLTAGAMARGGELFILDMGEPVKILDLAERLIKLSRYEPYKDIDIVFTGLRPGEKLYEEPLLGTCPKHKTEHEKIFIEETEKIDPEKFRGQLDILEKASHVRDNEKILEVLKEVVPSYKHKKN